LPTSGIRTATLSRSLKRPVLECGQRPSRACETAYSLRCREGVSLLKNSMLGSSTVPNRALEPRNGRFRRRIEGQKQATGSFSTAWGLLGNPYPGSCIASVLMAQDRLRVAGISIERVRLAGLQLVQLAYGVIYGGAGTSSSALVTGLYQCIVCMGLPFAASLHGSVR
jgi:hypothetical protein